MAHSERGDTGRPRSLCGTCVVVVDPVERQETRTKKEREMRDGDEGQAESIPGSVARRSPKPKPVRGTGGMIARDTPPPR